MRNSIAGCVLHPLQVERVLRVGWLVQTLLLGYFTARLLPVQRYSFWAQPELHSKVPPRWSSSSTYLQVYGSVLAGSRSDGIYDSSILELNQAGYPERPLPAYGSVGLKELRRLGHWRVPEVPMESSTR